MVPANRGRRGFDSFGAVASRTSTTKHTDLPPINVLHSVTRDQRVAVLESSGALNLVRWVNNKIDILDIGFG